MPPLQYLAPASSYPLAVAPLLHGGGAVSSYPLAVAPLLHGPGGAFSSRKSAEVLTGENSLVYIGTKSSPFRSGKDEQAKENDDRANLLLDDEDSKWFPLVGIRPRNGRFSIGACHSNKDTETILDARFVGNDLPYHPTNPAAMSHLGVLSHMHHIAPGLHQTSLTLASPILGSSGLLDKEFSTLRVEDYLKEPNLPFARRRSVNVPLKI